MTESTPNTPNPKRFVLRLRPVKRTVNISRKSSMPAARTLTPTEFWALKILGDMEDSTLVGGEVWRLAVDGLIDLGLATYATHYPLRIAAITPLGELQLEWEFCPSRKGANKGV